MAQVSSSSSPPCHQDVQGGKARLSAGACGFTMIELLAVLAIMAIVMSITISAFMQFGRTSGMRGATMNVKSALVMARQLAITRRVRADFRYGNIRLPNKPPQGFYVISDASKGGDLSNTNFLATGVLFGDRNGQLLPENGAGRAITFKLDGSLKVSPPNPVYLSLVEAAAAQSGQAGALTRLVQVNQYTGRAKITEPEVPSGG